MARITMAGAKAMEAARTHRLSMVSVGKEPSSNKWCVWERDKDGRLLYRRAFASEAEAMAHGQERLTGGAP